MRKLNLCIFDDTPKNVYVSAYEKWGWMDGWMDGLFAEVGRDVKVE